MPIEQSCDLSFDPGDVVDVLFVLLEDFKKFSINVGAMLKTRSYPRDIREGAVPVLGLRDLCCLSVTFTPRALGLLVLLDCLLCRLCDFGMLNEGGRC